MDNFDLRKYLAEGRLFEEENPIWTIDSFEDSADIEQAGPLYKKAIIDIIKAKHSNISSKDLEKSIEVTNNFWYDEARDNAKGSDPEDIKVSAKEFADGAIEYYEDALMDGEDNDSGAVSSSSLDDKLDFYLHDNWSGLPNLNPYPKEERLAFRNYAKKRLPSNASSDEIQDLMRKYDRILRKKYYPNN